MVENERELLLDSLKGYLEELGESDVEELQYAQLPKLPIAPKLSVAPELSILPENVPSELPELPVLPEQDCQGVGNPRARLLLAMTGTGFAGAAGDLLAKIIQAMGFVTSDVFLLSFNAGFSGVQSPSREVLLDRIAAVGPEVVVTLGEQAAQLLLQSGDTVGSLRGRFHDFQGIVLMPTLHPDAMLENAALKREVWSDMQQVMARLAQAS